MATGSSIQKLTERSNYAHKQHINGIDLYYEFYPNQQATHTLVFLHGFLASGFSFRYLIPELMKKYQIINIDFPPFGKSGKTLSFTFSYENIAKTIIDLLHLMRLKEIILVGHSMGGQICLNMILKQPEQFEKVILLASSGYLQQVKRHLIWLSYFPFASYFVKRRLVQSGGVEGNLKNVVYDPSTITGEMIEGYLEPYVENEDIFKALAKFMRDREGDLSQTDLQQIETPSLLIWGEYDKIVPIEVGKRLQQDLVHSQFTLLKNTGHLIPEERPDETIQLIDHFIKYSTI